MQDTSPTYQPYGMTGFELRQYVHTAAGPEITP